MRIILSYVRAFRRGFTYDVRRNAYLWFGVLWGLPIPVFSLYLDRVFAGGDGRPLGMLLSDHPIHFVFLLHPVVFGLVFGAMGTLRHTLEEANTRLIRTLTEQAETDPLTGVHNRRYVLDELQKALTRSRRTAAPVCVVLFDLDNFKQVNESRGHQAGDEVLRRVAAALAGVLRESDALGRYGGDEFLLVASGDQEAARHLVSRAVEALSARTGITVSAGIAQWPEDGDTPEALVGAADGRLASEKGTRHVRRPPTPEENPARR